MGLWYLAGVVVVLVGLAVREAVEWRRLKRSREPLARTVRELQALAQDTQEHIRPGS